MGIILTIIFIFLGVVFDMIGLAVATSDEAQFHSMVAKRVKGAKMALKLKKNADKVSSFCNDVVGDICGIVSGSTGAVIAIKIVEIYNFNNLIVVLIVMGIISSLTIGGKALEKGIAMKKSNKILFNFAKILSIFSKE
jgi:CBS domain containing-hemolysin-like protein